MELSDYLKVVRRRWVSIVVVTLVCTVLAVAYTLLQTKQYASSARLFVSTTAADPLSHTPETVARGSPSRSTLTCTPIGRQHTGQSSI